MGSFLAVASRHAAAAAVGADVVGAVAVAVADGAEHHPSRSSGHGLRVHGRGRSLASS